MPIPNKINGTLILAVAYDEGLVIAGDTGGGGGVGDEIEFKLENQRKVISLAPKIVMAAVGTPYVVEPDDRSTYYVNTPDVARDYFQKHVFDNSDEFWSNLRECVAIPYRDYVEMTGDTTELSLTVPFFYEAGRRLWLRTISLEYNDKEERIDVETLAQHSFGGLFAYWGHAHVAEGLYFKRPKFRMLASHASIRYLVDSNKIPADITLERALIFIRKVMEQSSILEPSKGHFSREFVYETLEGNYVFQPGPV